MPNKIHLLGDMGVKFGEEWSFSGDTFKDAFSIIDCQTTGFKKYLIEAAEAGLEAAIIVGDSLIEEEERVFMRIPKGDIYFALIPHGSKKGWGKILAAIVIAVFTFFLAPYATGPIGEAFVGAGYALATNLALAGVSELLAKPPGLDDAEKDNILFDGPQSTIKQGSPVPLLYGQLLVGGTPISVSFDTSVSGPGAGAIYAPSSEDVLREYGWVVAAWINM